VVSIAPWTCPTCKVTVPTPFCAECGEEPVTPADMTLRGLAAKGLHALTSIDARAARSAGVLLRRPGELTLAWANGIRKPYVAPFQLFLIANVFFFAVQWATNENVFSSSLESHLHQQDWSELAQSSLFRRLTTTGMTVAQYEPIFDRAVVLNAKSLILLMAFPFALLLPLAFLRERRPFMTHVVFALHLYTFLLLLFCVALVAAKLNALLGFGGLNTPMVDNVLSVLNLGACMVYVYLSARTVYCVTGVRRVATSIALAVAVSAIVLGYRFLLFFITLYGT
jgi:hypothetical protein